LITTDKNIKFAAMKRYEEMKVPLWESFSLGFQNFGFRIWDFGF